MNGKAESPLTTCGLFTDSSTIDWGVIDAEFSAILSPVHQCLASDEISASEAADIASALFKVHLEQYDVLPSLRTSHSNL